MREIYLLFLSTYSLFSHFFFLFLSYFSTPNIFLISICWWPQDRSRQGKKCSDLQVWNSEAVTGRRLQNLGQYWRSMERFTRRMHWQSHFQASQSHVLCSLIEFHAHSLVIKIQVWIGNGLVVCLWNQYDYQM